MVDGFKRILLPIDFSEHCDRAAEYAAWFARSSGGMIHLVHVIVNPADPIYEPGEVVSWDLVEHSEKKARSFLEAIGDRCLPTECAREYHIVEGDPYEKLAEAVEQIKPDLVVMSSHGRGTLATLLMGSVAERMVRHAPCPVFVVRRAD
ncbi:MAG TPA: universal stress protein [Candidatus Margulisiibacteriota bacterium]|nr:universal stress protein [Candidatus Margulisiibacteriota bacterium]